MTKTTVPREKIEAAMYEAGLDESALRDDYSGRGMYGDECFGIVTDGPGLLLQFAVALAAQSDPDNDEFDVEVMGWIAGVREDSMGLSTIYYWPGVVVES